MDGHVCRVGDIRRRRRAAGIRRLPLQRAHGAMADRNRRARPRAGHYRLRFNAERPGVVQSRELVRARRRRGRRRLLPPARPGQPGFRARPSGVGGHRHPAGARLPGARGLGPALAGAAAGHVQARRRPAEHQAGRPGGRVGRRPDRRAASPAAGGRGRVPAGRDGGARARDPARRQQVRRARHHRRDQRLQRRRAGRGDHQVPRPALAEPAPGPGPGLDRVGVEGGQAEGGRPGPTWRG